MVGGAATYLDAPNHRESQRRRQLRAQECGVDENKPIWRDKLVNSINKQPNVMPPISIQVKVIKG